MAIQDSAAPPPIIVPPAFDNEPRGLGGWLILPIIGFFGTAILTAVNLGQALASWNGIVAIFTLPEMAGARAPMVVSFAGGTLVILSAVFCLYLMFTRKRAIVKFATAHYLILAAAGLLDLWGQGELERAIPNMPPDPSAIRDAVRGMIVAAIWIPYFNVSKRVRNTFVNPPAVG